MRDSSPSLWTAGPEGPRRRCERWSSSGWRAALTWPWWGSRPDGPRRPPRPGAWPPPPAAASSRAGPHCCRGQEPRHGETQPADSVWFLDWRVSSLNRTKTSPVDYLTILLRCLTPLPPPHFITLSKTGSSGFIFLLPQNIFTPVKD